MNTRVGIIGTGILGSAVAQRLLNSGYKIAVYNRTIKKAEPLAVLGATICQTPKEVAKSSDLVITIVKDAHAVNEVSFGKDGIIEGYHDGLTVADMSTISPQESVAIAKRFQESKIEMLEIPVMGGPPVAETGHLLMMIAGKKEVYEKYKKILDCIADKSFYLGINGTALAIKLAMNLQISMTALALSEGITLTKGAGLDPQLFLQILNASDYKTRQSEKKGPKMIKGEFDATFTIQNMQKDLDTINAAAKAFNLSLPMTSLAQKLYQDAASEFAQLDYTGILAYIEKATKQTKTDDLSKSVKLDQ
ncbi:MAG: NAD(P)-dependent oxidoreductase [Nitrosopumilaceae archaeon]